MATPDMNADAAGTVAARIRACRNRLARAELAVADVLASGYPTSGMVPIVQLAAAAGVSAPTVLRMIAKLGFDGYPAFQAALRAEAQARIFSPLDTYPAAPEGTGGALPAYLEMLHGTFAGNAGDEIAAAVAALADPEAEILVLGGRFSHVLADQLAHYLSILRPGVAPVSAGTGGRLASLLDCGPRTVAVVFDFRRYQARSIDWGREAKARGARLILVTDQVLSPLSPSAD
uniref:MurR/RpiR family transcriptional regulator n=1 Tax=Mangrovicoccus sp. HB161399 TaxID=2720392 RepID=UPI0015582329